MRTLTIAFLLSLAVTTSGFAQPKAAPQPAKAAAPAPAKAAPAATSKAPPATLAQLMKGLFYPDSNVIFFAQGTDPKDVAPDKDAATAVNPLASAYGKWEAVENAALAIADATNLLTIPGRKCSNGRAVPMANADWAKLVAGLRESALTTYKAAQAKDQDKIVDAAGDLTVACSNCHDKYREPAVRCK